MLTAAERRRPVANAVVGELLATAVEQTTWEAKGVAFDRALATVDQEDEDERERLLILVMDALGWPRE